LRDDDCLKHRGSSAKISGFAYFLKGHHLVYFDFQELKDILAMIIITPWRQNHLKKDRIIFTFLDWDPQRISIGNENEIFWCS
jgi:hypothetical protein